MHRLIAEVHPAIGETFSYVSYDEVDLELRGAIASGRTKTAEFKEQAGNVLRKIGKQMRKDYLVHPLLSGPSFMHTFAADACIVSEPIEHDPVITLLERERIEAYSRLSEQVIALGATTTTLSRALRTPAVRGRWGEMQLRRVVEIAGMLNRCDFDEQPGL